MGLHTEIDFVIKSRCAVYDKSPSKVCVFVDRKVE